MAEQDDSPYSHPEVLHIFEVIPEDELPEPGDDGHIPEDAAWEEYRADDADDAPYPALSLEIGNLVVIMTLADLGAQDLEGAYAELATGSYQQQVYNQGASLIVIVGAAETEKLLWANFHLGDAAMHGIAFTGLAERVRRSREEAAESGRLVLTDGPLVATVLEPGEVTIGNQLVVDNN